MTGTRVRPDYIPAELKTLDQIEEWAHDVGISYYDALWAYCTAADLHDLAARSDTTVADLVGRMVAAGGPGVVQ